MLTKEQLIQRKKGIGGSDVAAILLPDWYRDIIDVYKDKISDEVIEQEESQKIHWGNVLEEPIAKEYEKQTGNEVITVKERLTRMAAIDYGDSDLMLIHPQYRWAVANIDRFYRTAEGFYGILEIKTTSKYYMSGWKYDIPLEYYFQVQHYMWIAKALGLIQLDLSHIAILAGGQEFTIIPVPMDPKYLANSVPILDKFWNENVMKRIPPEPATGKQVEKLYTSLADKEIEASDDVANLAMHLAEIKSQIRTLESEEESLQNAIKVIMKDAELLTHQGDLLATWKYQTQLKFKQKEFEKDYPHLAVQYKKESGYRKFLCKIGATEDE